MMHIAILIIAIVLVGTGIFMRTRSEDRILGESVPTQTPTQPPTQTPTPPAEQDTQSSSTTLTDFIYPSANISAQSDSSLTLTSTDEAHQVTDWYKNKIKELGMNTRSFVQTKTNDNVHNVLAAAKGNDEIKVTITKNSGDSSVSIVISRSSY